MCPVPTAASEIAREREEDSDEPRLGCWNASGGNQGIGLEIVAS